jgi:hypothetical protein
MCEKQTCTQLARFVSRFTVATNSPRSDDAAQLVLRIRFVGPDIDFARAMGTTEITPLRFCCKKKKKKKKKKRNTFILLSDRLIAVCCFDL